MSGNINCSGLREFTLPATNTGPVISTSAGSPDTLPMRGYTVDQLADYILRQLGNQIFKVEISRQIILDSIQDALGILSIWVPGYRYGSIRLNSSISRYLEGVDVGLGVIKVWFVEPYPTPTEMFYGNLIDPAPLMRTGLDDFDSFVRWRKTWQRVMSVKPDWIYDEFEQVLLIHNPIQRYMAGVACHFPHTKTENLSYYASQWVKKYSVEKARWAYGEAMSKFSGAVPGPLQQLQFDANKRSDATAALDKLELELKTAQVSTPIDLD